MAATAWSSHLKQHRDDVQKRRLVQRVEALARGIDHHVPHLAQLLGVNFRIVARAPLPYRLLGRDSAVEQHAPERVELCCLLHGAPEAVELLFRRRLRGRAAGLRRGRSGAVDAGAAARRRLLAARVRSAAVGRLHAWTDVTQWQHHDVAELVDHTGERRLTLADQIDRCHASAQLLDAVLCGCNAAVRPSKRTSLRLACFFSFFFALRLARSRAFFASAPSSSCSSSCTASRVLHTCLW
jgi:hypothetical protein